MKFAEQYHSKSKANQTVVDQVTSNDGKIQRVFQSGRKEVIFSNGVRRESWNDGYTIVYFNN